jgi:hypothetical protein
LIQSSGAGRIEQIRGNSISREYEREPRLNSDPCLGEIEGKYCKIRTACARYWALSEKNQNYIRPALNGFDECDSRAWLIDEPGMKERFKLSPMMGDIDISAIHTRWRERNMDKS